MLQKKWLQLKLSVKKISETVPEKLQQNSDGHCKYNYFSPLDPGPKKHFVVVWGFFCLFVCLFLGLVWLGLAVFLFDLGFFGFFVVLFLILFCLGVLFCVWLVGFYFCLCFCLGFFVYLFVFPFFNGVLFSTLALLKEGYDRLY